ncbi:hypothetical protein L2E68_08465 [Planktothrix agardhii 1029]|jgi:hypothetical protein|uniref:hypothetical protein n=1 Tax=Planktothrix agardhii TaxID=1160 RepID=UPI001D0AB034|nr:hypothetical protein [Planktothrix agardhii]MCB8764579.1 hypothetical protein [Planktothrix agardhii 1809]MCB8766261.1 hypothetical protein [Planktothrix agardhii 1809]MCB8778235.1 hypothetical protein [Planktothrix agardhii 1031]MCB8782637.1 hypothetical protein [Planktothrix agardhii 1808]MCF3566333.1 hypothetical protein [Planktothrix agardhii 1807]
MSRPIRIGLIAEGEAELGASIPYIKPEDGGKIIDKNKEGALHTLIRRELKSGGLSDCDFVQRHPSINESRVCKLRTGHSILDPKYLAQVVISWKPEEVDLILIVVDADDKLPQRQIDLGRALNKIRDNHLDVNDQPINDRSAGGLAIKNFEAWLLADIQTVSMILDVEIEQLENIETLDDIKNVLETAIAKSTYLSEVSSNQRPLQIRWKLGFEIDLDIIKTCCSTGYAPFTKCLMESAKVVMDVLETTNSLQSNEPETHF